MDILLVIILIIFSGAFSGLTIGLMGLSRTEVKRLSVTGSQESRAQARKVLSLIEESNLLLVTLLLGNTAVNSTLAIFLGSIATGAVAGIISTVLILIFGEILPAAFLSKYALAVGSKCAPIVKFLMKITWIFTSPIAKALDRFVGKEGLTFLSREELVHIVTEHEMSEESDIDGLDKKALVGTLLLSDKIVGDHMSQDVYYIDVDVQFTQCLLDDIKLTGHTRIPVTENGVVVGLINVKTLLGIKADISVTARDLISKKHIIRVKTSDNLDNVLNKMINTKQHMVIATSYDKFVGIITMEDILEELLLTEIVDEFDKH